MSFSTWPSYRPGLHWQVESGTKEGTGRQFSRRLGALEQQFDKASQSGGQSDTFIKLRLHLKRSGGEGGRDMNSVFFSRILLAWTQLRSINPVLAATLHDDRQELVPGCPGRRIAYVPPPTWREAVLRAQNSILLARTTGDLEAKVEEIQNEYVLNGPQLLIDEKSCLARLIFVESEASANELGFFLVISHVISDGLSALKLVNDLFRFGSSDDLSSPPVPSSSFPLFHEFSRFIKGDSKIVGWEVPEGLLKNWRTLSDDSEILASLPLAIEDHFPPLPLSSSVPCTNARRRWIWAIARVILLARQKQAHPGQPFPTAPPATHVKTRWDLMKFGKPTTARLIRFCKRNRQSPSMLLYSILALSASNFFASGDSTPPTPYRPIRMTFPYSGRPLLEKFSTQSTDPSQDLAARLAFTSLVLPNFPLALKEANSKDIRRVVLLGAKLAKKQISQTLSSDPYQRTIYLAACDAVGVDRVHLRYGKKNPSPWTNIGSSVDGSMIGDVDRTLESRVTFASEGFELGLSGLEVGIRMHAAEGMFYEGFTFEGCLQLGAGYDQEMVRFQDVAKILEGVKEIGELIASSEKLEEE